MSGSLVRDSLLFSWSRNVLLVLSFVRNLVLARILGPDAYGWWVVIWLVLTYGDQIHLGLRHAGDREVPYALGSGDTERAVRLARVILGGIVMLTVVAVLAFSAVVLGFGVGSSAVKATLVIAGLTILADQITRYHLMLLRTRREFVFSGKIEVAFEAARTLLVCIGAALAGVVGAITAFLIVSAGMGATLSVRHGEAGSPIFSWTELRPVAVAGGALFLSGIMFILLQSVDRFAGSLMLGSTELGLYGMGALVMQLPVVTSQAVMMVLYPKMSSELGRAGTLQAVRGTYTEAMLSLALVSPLFAMALLFGSEFLVGLLLPAYGGSLRVMGYLAYGVICFALVPLPMGLFMVTGRNLEYLLITGIGIFCAGVCMVILRGILGPLAALAVAADVLFWVVLAVLLFRGSILLGYPKWECLRNTARTLAPLAAGCVLFALTGIVFPHSLEYRLAESIGNSLIKSLIFIAGFTPVLVLAGRQLNLISRLRKLTHG